MLKFTWIIKLDKWDGNRCETGWIEIWNSIEIERMATVNINTHSHTQMNICHSHRPFARFYHQDTESEPSCRCWMSTGHWTNSRIASNPLSRGPATSIIVLLILCQLFRNGLDLSRNHNLYLRQLHKSFNTPECCHVERNGLSRAKAYTTATGQVRQGQRSAYNTTAQ